MKSQPFLFPLSGLICGILFSESFRMAEDSSLKYWIGIFFLAVFIWLLRKKSVFPLIVLTVFAIYGFLFSDLNNRWQPLPSNLIENELVVSLKIDEIYRSSKKFRKYNAQILSVDSTQTDGNSVLLYWSKQNPELFPDEEIRIKTKLLNVQKPLNPYGFDYSKYLERKGIHYTIFHSEGFEKLKEASGFVHWSSVFKRKIHSQMIENGYSKAAADLVGAMLLGDRTEMDPEIEDDFRRTGVVHLLAISGLHVMMVFSIIMILLYPLVQLKNGKNIRILVSLILIWAFVAFVDFRPPVFRSGLMISIYYITVLLKRKPNIYHTLMVSALILLLYNSNFLFDPGFLLSYSAVFFIVYFNPIYRKLLKPKSQISKRIIDFTGTTVSAQMGTLPFSVFFFHQTSGLFLAGNAVMIAASYLMVSGGILTVFLTSLGIDFGWWQKLFDGFIGLCYSYVHWLSQFDGLVFDRLSFTIFELLILIVVVLMMRQLFFGPKPKYLFVFLSLIFVFEIQRIYRLNRLMNKEEIIVFHQNRNTVIGVRKGLFMDVFIADWNDTVQIKKYIIRPYEIHQKIKRIRLLDLDSEAEGNYRKTKNLIELGNKRLIFYNPEIDSFIRENDFVLIRNNSKFDSVRQNVLLITDGSNYPNHSDRIDYPKIWNTRKNGALVID
ncbi:MAG: ComEC/Rec2 family competence protein [Weeksellaceae bacterium]